MLSIKNTLERDGDKVINMNYVFPFSLLLYGHCHLKQLSASLRFHKINKAQDQGCFLINFSYFFTKKKICCGYSLEVPHRGTSNEYPQYIFLWSITTNINNCLVEKKALSGTM